MTREEAIKIIDCYDIGFYDLSGAKIPADKLANAFDMAIEALQTEVVRCEDCIQKHIGGSVTQYYWCDLWDREVDCNNGCSWGERKGGEDE